MGNRILKLVALLGLLCGFASGQVITSSTNGTATTAAVVSGSQINLIPGGSTNVTFTWTVLGAPATISVQGETSTNNGVSYAICGQAITTTSGTQTINCAGVFDHAQLNITTLTGGASPSIVWSVVATAPLGGGLNPCQNSNFATNSVSVNISTATTTQAVAPLTGAKVTICGFLLVVTGTVTPTVQLEYGTGATCAGSTVTLTGVMTPLTGTVLSYGIGGSSLKSSAVSNGFCIVTTGTISSIAGVVTFIQQ
jgi:hypothetical protein